MLEYHLAYIVTCFGSMVVSITHD